MISDWTTAGAYGDKDSDEGEVEAESEDIVDWSRRLPGRCIRYKLESGGFPSVSSPRLTSGGWFVCYVTALVLIT